MLSDEQYFELCNLCDSLLNRKKKFYRVAIPWLHILKWHPSLLEEYVSCFHEKKFRFHLFNNLKFLLIYICGWLAILYRACFIRYQKIQYLSKPRVEYDILLVSHYLGVGSLSLDQDHYYGALHKDLERDGIKVLRAFINQTGDINILGQMRGVEISDSLVLPKSENLLWQLIIFLGFFGEFLSLLWGAIFSPLSGSARFICFRAAIEALSGGSRDAVVIARSVLKVINAHKVSAVLFTYEGHAWEKIFVSLGRKYANSTKLIGYQFVGLTKGHHAINRGLGYEYDPDIVMCTGESAIESLKNALTPCSSSFDVLGTFRLPKLNHTSENFEKKRRLETSICLILPEGLDQEVFRLVGYAQKLAKKNPMIEFVIRLHPITTQSDFLRGGYFENLPTNMRLSNSDLITDATAAKWAIYQGSTSILQCFALGVTPFYLHQDSLINIDVLMQDSSSPYFLTATRDFDELINDWHSSGVRDEWLCSVLSHLNAMYKPFNSLKILEILENSINTSDKLT